MKCEHCGAPTRDAAIFCEHCGSRVTRPTGSLPPSRVAAAAERFERALTDPAYKVALAHTPAVSSTARIAGPLIFSAFTVLLVSFGVVGLASSKQREPPPNLTHDFMPPEIRANPEFQRHLAEIQASREHVDPTPQERDAGLGGFMIMWIGMGLVIAGAGVAMAIRGVRFRNAPLRRELALVVDERTRVHGGKATTTDYFATLQTRDGQRSEYACEGWLAGRIAPDDLGVAFVKLDHLVDFIRLEV